MNQARFEAGTPFDAVVGMPALDPAGSMVCKRLRQVVIRQARRPIMLLAAALLVRWRLMPAVNPS